MKLKTLVSIIVFVTSLSAQNLVFIPDSSFRNFLQNQYPQVMQGDSLIIDSAATVTGSFDCSNQNIADLTGIEYFVNISELLCQDNQLTFIPSLADLDSLRWLRCDNNQLTTLPDLSSNTELELLWCSGNQLTSLPDLHNLTKLDQLRCSGNQLTSLPDLSNQGSLSQLLCDHNQLTSLPDLSNNNLLTRLRVHNNQLTSLPDLSNNDILEELTCENNRLESLPDLSNMIELFLFTCQNNKLDFSDARELRIADALPTLLIFNYAPQNPFGHPRTVSFPEGKPATISITPQDSATGYQWFKDGMEIPGATDYFLHFSSIQLSDSGVYTCKSFGTALDSAHMQHPPGITEFISEPITVVVIPNHPPEFITTELDTAFEEIPYQFQLLASDIDNDSLTYEKLAGPAWLNLSPISGLLTGTPAVTDTGTFPATFVVLDNRQPLLTDTLFTQITVAPVNDPPVFLTTHLDTALEDRPYQFQLEATDEENDSLYFSKLAGPDWLAVTTEGLLHGTPAVSDTGVHPVILQVTDSGTPPRSDTLNTEIVVQSVNDPPYFLTTSLDTALEDHSYHFQLMAADEENDSLIFSKISGPGWLQVSPQGLLSGTPTYQDTGLFAVQLLVLEAENPSNNDLLNTELYVQWVNDAPRFITTHLDTAIEGHPYSFQLEVEDEEGNAITFIALQIPSWLQLSSDGKLTGTPGVSEIGEWAVSIRIVDDGIPPGSDTLTTTLLVLRENVPPAITTSIFQNPAATRFADVVVVSDLPLQKPPDVKIWVEKDTTDVSMQPIPGSPYSYRGTIVFGPPGIYWIQTHAIRPNGVDSLQIRNFSVGLGIPGKVAMVLSADQQMALYIAENSLSEETYFVIDSDEADGNTTYYLSPAKQFAKPLKLEIRYASEQIPDPGKLYIARARAGNREPLPTRVFKNPPRAETFITSGGEYRLIYDPTFEGNNLIPDQFALYQNFPNPFNPTTTIEYDLAADSRVRLVIYNILGQRIRVLVDAFQQAGCYQVRWDARDDWNHPVGNGLYFYRLETETATFTRKMLLLK